MADENVSLLLEKHLEMKNVREMAERFTAALAGGVCLTLDGSAVQRIDSAGLQLLLAMVHSAHDEGMDVAWRKPSAALQEAAAMLGLVAELNLPEEA